MSVPTIVPRTAEADEGTFVARLSNANTGSGSWHDGWTVRTHDGQGTLGLERGDLRLWAHQSDFLPDDGCLGVGAVGRVRFPNEYLNLYPGHYVALGNTHRGQHHDAVRLYWNVTSDGAPHLLTRLSDALNAASIDFQLKILNSPFHYDRTDAAILYLPVKDWAASHSLVVEAREDLSEWLKPAVSAYVLPLGPGLGFAEDPLEHVSFGQHRSRILATSLSAASDEEDALDAVLRGVTGAGLEIERFYMNPGSRHEYSP